jgi:hypothetical protein
VAGCASTGTLEVLFARFGIAGLQIGDIHPLASAFLRERDVALSVYKRRQAGNLLRSYIKVRHAFLRASTANNCADLASIHVGGHEAGAREIGAGFSAARIAAVTKGAIFPEERAPALDKGRRI